MIALFSQLSKGRICRYYNARILRNHQLLNGELWSVHGKIIPPQTKVDLDIDVRGLILAPGYIDLQINGAFGIDFSISPERVGDAAKLLPQYGVTAFLPTVVSNAKNRYQSIIPLLQPKVGGSNGASILGIHLEGPFLNSMKSGAHNPSFITSIDNQALDSFYGSLDGVKIVTLAPEIPGALEAIRYLSERNIIAAAGHSLATYSQMRQAIDAGIRLATHLFNAMPPLDHREPGMVGAVLIEDKLFYSVIADGEHLHPAILNIAWKCHPQGLVLITDAMAALGQPKGSYRLGTMDVDVKENRATLAGTETLAGSILSMDKAVRFLQQCTGCSAVQAIEAASLMPARILGIQGAKGLLEGADADFIFLDDSLNVQATVIAGELAWKKPY